MSVDPAIIGEIFGGGNNKTSDSETLKTNATSEEVENEKKERKNKFTSFLERNEIWFKTVLSVALTTAALFVSMASCRNSQYQAQLAAVTAGQESREKNPFFSIEQYYD